MKILATIKYALYPLLTGILVMTVLSCRVERETKESALENPTITELKERAKDQILVCAHRSFHKKAPENSLKSIKDAIQAKIDMVELDVRTTRDSILVLMHDDSLGRVTTGIGKISDFTFDELQKLQLKMGDSVTKHRIPKLKDALLLLKGSNCVANLDLKSVNYASMYRMLKTLDMTHSVVSFIGKQESVMKMVGIDSLYAVMPLIKTRKELEFYDEHITSSLRHFTDESFNKDMMSSARNNNQIVFINALWDEDEGLKVGDERSLEQLIKLRPSIIQTDYPDLMMTYLKERGLHR